MIIYTTPHAIRVEIINNVHCLVVTGKDSIRSFYLVNETYGDPVFMFACKAENDADAAAMAAANAADYIPNDWK